MRNGFLFVILANIFFFLQLDFGFAIQEQTELRFLRGLVDQGLFESVEYYYSSRLNSTEWSPSFRNAIAGELVRSRTGQMLLADPKTRNALRQRLKTLQTELLSQKNDTSLSAEESLSRIQLRFQFAIAERSLGDWQRLEADIAALEEKKSLLQAARETLLNALEQFQRCREDLELLRQRQASVPDQDFERSSLSLLRTIAFQAGLSQISLALSFPTGNDRSFGLEQAVNLLSEPASLSVDDLIVAQSRLELAVCYRLLGKLEQCHKLLLELERFSLNTDLRDRASAETLRFYLDMGQLEEALRLFAQKPFDVTDGVEFELARLEMFQKLHSTLRQSDRSQDEKAVTYTILEQVRQIEQHYGIYQGRRARMILAQSIPSTGSQATPSTDSDGQLLSLLAKEQYLQGRFSESIKLFQRAAQEALLAGRSDQAFEYAKGAVAVLASVQERLAQSKDASPEAIREIRHQTVQTLCETALQFKEKPDASELHLMAIDLSAESLLQGESSQEEYLNRLQEHVRLWPNSEKIPPLLFRMAQLLEQQDQIRAALSVLAQIPNRSPLGAQTVDAVSRCLDRAEGMTVQESVQYLLDRLPTPPTSWSEADTLCAMASAEYLLKRNPDRSSQEAALQAVEQALILSEKMDPTPSKIRATQRQALMIRLLLGMGRKQEAAGRMDHLDLKQVDSMSLEEKRSFQRIRAELLADTDRTGEAVQLLSTVLKEDPNNEEIWQCLAEILTRREDPQAQAKAVQIWTKIESRATKESETWWNAKERILELKIRQGKKEEARKSYDLLRILYPTLGDTQRKKRLETLFAQ